MNLLTNIRIIRGLAVVLLIALVVVALIKLIQYFKEDKKVKFFSTFIVMGLALLSLFNTYQFYHLGQIEGEHDGYFPICTYTGTHDHNDKEIFMENGKCEICGYYVSY